jgi:anti-sigma28 factor (negative regulator of flagellin synthesis)
MFLFVILLIILAINPKVVNNMYNNILGRLLLVCVIIFCSINNTTLGLLSVLIIISGLNKFGSFVEGMTNETPTTIGEENTDTTGSQVVLTNSAVDSAKKKISDLKQSIADGTTGIDKEDIKTAIMSKDSKQIPVDTNMNSSSEVEPSSSGILNPSSGTLEGFSQY